MSGPIVRSGPSEKFSSNWDKVFAGGGAADEAPKAAEKKSTKAKAAKTAKKAKKK